MQSLKLGIVTLFIIAFTACDRPNCQNTNLIFKEFKIESEEYKTELIKQINIIGEENLSYWFNNYEVEDQNEYLIVNIQSDSLCAKALILVTDWKGIEGIRKTKGKGYHGAELKDFTFSVNKSSGKTELIFKSIDRIID